MYDYEPDWIEGFMSEDTFMIDESVNEDWDTFWSRVTKFAKERHISTRYVEEEFIINGELMDN